MDTGKGTFKQVDEITAEKFPDRTFRVGEIVNIKSSRFEVTRISAKTLRLKLLPKKK